MRRISVRSRSVEEVRLSNGGDFSKAICLDLACSILSFSNEIYTYHAVTLYIMLYLHVFHLNLFP